MKAVTQWLQQYSTYVGIPLLLLAVVAWIYRPSARRRYEEDGHIPFDEEKDKDERT